MVYYRKYRPQKIEDLDNQQVRETFFSVLALPEVPHAFLFTGPKGLGKTSAARILAKAVNCEERTKQDKKPKGEKDNVLALHEHLEPCNKCDQCKSITDGTNMDILEIDAASNRGIDEIRDLRDKIRLSPVSSRKKVYIIDEVHMLTTEAFNALLKTLEEPPSHAMFVLCTTELHKVPSTIISRCFHVSFQAASTDDIARSFLRIAKGEGLEIDIEATTQITLLAEGGFRDAHKILEELVAMGEKHITKETVEKRFKVSSSLNLINSLLESFQARDTNKGLDVITKVSEIGIDIKQFVIHLTEALHEIMLHKAGIEIKNLRYPVTNINFEMEDLRNLLILLNKVNNEMKYSVLPQLPLELAIIEWSLGNTTLNKETKTVIGKETSSANEQKFTRVVHNTVTISSLRKKNGDIAKLKALYGEPKPLPAPVDPDAKPIKDLNLLHVSNSEITKEWLDNFWMVLIREIKSYNHTIAGVLRSCMIKQFDKNNLVISTAYKFHKERLDDAKTREALEAVCKTLTGNSVRVEVVLSNKS